MDGYFGDWVLVLHVLIGEFSAVDLVDFDLNNARLFWLILG
jgi:hypothetical protein